MSAIPPLRSFIGLVLISCTLFACGDGDERLTPTRDKESPTGVYIPADLNDSFAELDRMLPSAFVEQFRSDESMVVLQHFGLGLWLRNNWGLWSDSRLAKYFHQTGVTHPDHMSGVILTSYWRRLNELPLNADSQLAYYRQYERAAADPEPLSFAECPGGAEIRGGRFAPPGEPAHYRHIAICPEDARWWAYEVERGWFAPDSSDIAGFER